MRNCRQMPGLSTSQFLKRKQTAKFCRSVTLHGVPDFYDEPSPVVKAFWLICISLAISASVFGCYQILREFYERPIAVSYTVNYDKDRKLPDTIICPFSSLKRSFLTEHQISNDLAEYIINSFGNAVPYEQFYTYDPSDISDPNIMAEKLDEVLLRLNMSWRDFVDKASLTCEDIIVACPRVGDPMYQCCDGSLKAPFSTYGKCIRIEGSVQQIAGFGYGSTMILKPLDEELVYIGKQTYMNRGISISFAGHGSQFSSGFTFIPTGVHALVGIKITQYSFLNNPPHYECVDNMPSDYDSEQCLDACFFEPSVKECSCYHFPLDGSFPNISHLCKPVEFEQCLLPAMRQYDPQVSDHMEKCRAKCLHPCQFKEFHPRLSFANFPSKTLRKFLANASFSLEDFTVLDVFNEQLHVTSIRQFPTFTGDQLLANIGGQISLYIGGSVLTVVQIIMFLCRTPMKAAARTASSRRRHDVINSPTTDSC